MNFKNAFVNCCASLSRRQCGNIALYDVNEIVSCQKTNYRVENSAWKDIKALQAMSQIVKFKRRKDMNDSERGQQMQWKKTTLFLII